MGTHSNHYFGKEAETKRLLTLPLALAALPFSLFGADHGGGQRGNPCNLGRSRHQATFALREPSQVRTALALSGARRPCAPRGARKGVGTAWRVLITVLALGPLAAACGSDENLWTVEAGASEAQQGVMHNCPQPGKWAISVWHGDDRTDTGQALATCTEGAVAAAYCIDPQTQGWLHWFAGRPELSNLGTLNDMQGVMALGVAEVPATTTPSPAPTATPTPVAGAITFRLYETLEMLTGQVARLEGTDIEVLLVEAHEPEPGCFDCPNKATLSVHSGDEVRELRYVFSGNMPLEALEKARRKEAFGFVFMAMKIVEGSLSIRVEPCGAGA